MSSITRPLTGPLLTFDLSEQLAELREDPAYARSGKVGRTLAKQGPFRLTMVALERGAEVETHHTENPLTLQVLSGRIRFRIGDETHNLSEGQILYFGPGAAHDIQAREATALLLTISMLSAGA